MKTTHRACSATLILVGACWISLCAGVQAEAAAPKLPLLIGMRVEKPLVPHEVVGLPLEGWKMTHAAFSTDGTLLALAGRGRLGPGQPEDGTVMIGDRTAGREIRRIPGELAAFLDASDNDSSILGRDVFDLAFSPDGSLLAIGTDRGIVLWPLQGEGKPRILYGFGREHPSAGRTHGSFGLSFAFSPDGKQFAVSDSQTVEMWSVADGTLQRSFGDMGAGAGVAFSPDGRLIATAEHNNRIHVWDAVSGKRLAEHHPGMGILRYAVFLDQGRRLAAVGEGGGIIYEVLRAEGLFAFGRSLRLKNHPGPGYGISAPGKGPLFATVNGSLVVTIWDASTGIRQVTLPSDPEANHRGTILYALARIGPAAKGAADALVPLLSDPAPDVRKMAARTLGAIDPETLARVSADLVVPKSIVSDGPGGPEYEGRPLREWIKMLGQHHVPNEIYGRSSQRRPVVAMRAFGAELAVPELIKALDDDDWVVQAGAVDGLGLFGAAAVPAVPTLVKQLSAPRQALSTRNRIAHTLASIGRASKSVPEELRELVNIDDPLVAVFVVRVVLAVDPDAAAARTRLSRCLEGSDPDKPQVALVLQALETLRVLGPSAAGWLPDLTKIVAEPEDDRIPGRMKLSVREAAAKAIGAIGPAAESAIPTLIDVILNESSPVAYAAGVALPSIGPAALPALIEALATAEEPKINPVWNALRRFGETARPALEKAAKDPRPKLREAAKQLLAGPPWTRSHRRSEPGPGGPSGKANRQGGGDGRTFRNTANSLLP